MLDRCGLLYWWSVGIFIHVVARCAILAILLPHVERIQGCLEKREYQRHLLFKRSQFVDKIHYFTVIGLCHKLIHLTLRRKLVIPLSVV